MHTDVKFNVIAKYRTPLLVIVTCHADKIYYYNIICHLYIALIHLFNKTHAATRVC